MGGTVERPSSFGQEVKSSSSVSHHDQRLDSRFRVADPTQYKVTATIGHTLIEAVCNDYSPFGMGLSFSLKPDLPLLSIGETIEVSCDFAGSKFLARGTIANTRVERLETGDFVRLGVALSRSAEVVRPAHVQRKSTRIQMNEGVSPLVFTVDELRFGSPIFGKMTDISLGGMRLVIDRHPLPFLEKQKHWFEIVLPVFGRCRSYCRIAYVRREEETHRYVVGCEFIDGGSEQELSALEDWLFYGNQWLTAADIRSAGFPLSHIHDFDEKYRVLISATGSGLSSPDGQDFTATSLTRAFALERQSERIEFIVGHESEPKILRMLLHPDDKILSLEAVEGINFSTDVLKSVWKSTLLFALLNRVHDLEILAEEQSSFFKRSLTHSLDSLRPVNLRIDELVAGNTLRWSFWREVYKNLACKKGLEIPAPSSFLRRIFAL